MSSSPPFLGVVPSGRTARLSRLAPRRIGGSWRAEPPSHRTSASRRIRRYEPAAHCGGSGRLPFPRRWRGPRARAGDRCRRLRRGARRPTASGRVLHAQVEHRCRRISTRIDPTGPVRTMRNQIGPGRSRPHRDPTTRSKRIGARPAPPRPCDARITGVGRGWRSRPEGVGPRTRAPIPRAGTAAAPPGWPACRRIDSGVIGSPAPDRRRGTDGPCIGPRMTQVRFFRVSPTRGMGRRLRRASRRPAANSGPAPRPGGRSGPRVWADAVARWRGRATVLARCRALASPRYFAAALATGNVASLPHSLPGMWLRHRATYLQP